MAGKYVTILRPGYSLLMVSDLSYTAGSGESASINPFKPTDLRPLVEGEWLELVASGTTTKYTRGGNNAMSVPGTPDGESSNPSHLYYMEEGNYVAQTIQMAHCVRPQIYEINTKLCWSDGLSVNSKVAVYDWDGRSSVFGLVRRVLAVQSGGYCVGRVSRIRGTDDIDVIVGIQ